MRIDCIKSHLDLLRIVINEDDLIFGEFEVVVDKLEEVLSVLVSQHGLLQRLIIFLQTLYRALVVVIL